jgi:hypothetical protein
MARPATVGSGGMRTNCYCRVGAANPLSNRLAGAPRGQATQAGLGAGPTLVVPAHGAAQLTAADLTGHQLTDPS